MRKFCAGIIFTGLVMVMVGLSGCATDTISFGVRDTPTPEIVQGPEQMASAVQPPVITIKPSVTVIPAPTLSAACRYLLAAKDDDNAFLKAVTDRKGYSGICSLAIDNCTIRAATELSQAVSTSPKPRTPLLVQARGLLLSASTSCFDPGNSVSQNRTRNDRDTYAGRVSQYAFLVSSCPGQSGEDIIASLKKSMEKQGETMFRGTGNTVQPVNVRTRGNTTFSLAYSGSSSFVVMLQDIR